MVKELSDKVHSQITALCKQGDEQANGGNYEGAFRYYLDALELLPANHQEWKAATWIYVAIGDACFKGRKYDKAFQAFANALKCPEGLGNPYIHLRLGQVQFERGNLTDAADELTRAYMGAGMEIFMEDDPKYLEFLETKIDL